MRVCAKFELYLLDKMKNLFVVYLWLALYAMGLQTQFWLHRPETLAECRYCQMNSLAFGLILLTVRKVNSFLVLTMFYL